MQIVVNNGGVVVDCLITDIGVLSFALSLNADFVLPWSCGIYGWITGEIGELFEELADSENIIFVFGRYAGGVGGWYGSGGCDEYDDWYWCGNFDLYLNGAFDLNPFLRNARVPTVALRLCLEYICTFYWFRVVIDIIHIIYQSNSTTRIVNYLHQMFWTHANNKIKLFKFKVYYEIMFWV